MADYIPQADAEFNLWQASLVTSVQAGATAWGILAADVTTLVALQTPWTTSFAKASNKHTRSTADVQSKDDARTTYEKGIRSFVAQWLASNAKVSNADRERMGLTVKTGTRTAAPVPTSVPQCSVDFSVRLQHSIRIADESGSKAKPAGVHGCELWCKIDGEAPKSPSELSYLGTATSASFVAKHDAQHAGKTIYYMLRWVNTRSEQGPWSSTYSAILVG